MNGDFSNTLSTKTYEYVSLDQMFRRHMETRKTYQYVSPDRSTFIPANKVYLQGEPYFGSKWSDILQTFGLVKASAGRRVYVTNESEEKTYSGTLKDDGTVSDLQLFAGQGGENLAEDKEGNVYMAAGQIFVYNPAGKLIDTIDVPERPNQLVFGGKDHRTLFILRIRLCTLSGRDIRGRIYFVACFHSCSPRSRKAELSSDRIQRWLTS